MSNLLDTVAVKCACGARLRAPLMAIGKSSPCPKCGAMLTVPSAAEADMGVQPDQIDFSMSKGILFACIAAIVVGGIWVGMSVALGNMLGMMGVGMGFACGIAMMMGTQRRSPEVGLIAAGIAIMGIMIAKAVVFMVFLSQGIAMAGDRIKAHPQAADEFLVITMDAGDADDKSAASNSPGDILKHREEMVREMTAEQKSAALKKATDKLAAQARENASLSDYFVSMYGLYDVVFLGLAFSAAYKTSTFHDPM